jgi:hypothetical protein
MKNKGFINPQLGIFILVGMLVVFGGAAFYSGRSSQNTVLGEQTSLPAGIPRLSYKRVKVMQTLTGETFKLTDPKYKKAIAKGYVFAAVPGQELEIVAEEMKDAPSYINTYLFDKTGKLLLSKDTRLDLEEYEHINRNYRGDYYVVVTNYYNDIRSFDFSVTDWHNINPVVYFRDYHTNKLINITVSQYINPNYVLPYSKGIIIVDYNNHIYRLAEQDIIYRVYSLPGTYSEHITNATPDKFAEDVSNTFFNAQALRINEQSLWLSLPADELNGNFGIPVELAPRTQYAVDPAAGVPVVRFWTK